MTEPARAVLLAGATGLVGGLALQRLLQLATFDHVVVVARRPLEHSHGRLRAIVTDFDHLEAQPPVPCTAARADGSAVVISTRPPFAVSE